MSSPYSLEPVGETNIDPRLAQGTIRQVFLSPLLPFSLIMDGFGVGGAGVCGPWWNDRESGCRD
jgi:hypothetical protein